MSKEKFNILADHYAKTIYGEFGYDTCSYEEREEIKTLIFKKYK